MKITLNKILSYIEGNFKYYLFSFIKAPTYIKEQYAYRIQKCKDDCIKNKACKYCGCDPIKKSFVNESCNNKEIFPDIMDKVDWKKYKRKNNIIIDE